MGRRRALLTQTDYVRAIRAAKECGAGAVEFMLDGTIRVLMTQPPEGSQRVPSGEEVAEESLPNVVL